MQTSAGVVKAYLGFAVALALQVTHQGQGMGQLLEKGLSTCTDQAFVRFLSAAQHNTAHDAHSIC